MLNNILTVIYAEGRRKRERSNGADIHLPHTRVIVITPRDSIRCQSSHEEMQTAAENNACMRPYQPAGVGEGKIAKCVSYIWLLAWKDTAAH